MDRASSYVRCCFAALSVVAACALGPFSASADAPIFAPAFESIPEAANPAAIAIADMNNDALPDIVVANAGSSNVSILLGDGTGGFVVGPSMRVGMEPSAIAIADLDGDSQPDIVVTNRGSQSVSVLLQDSAGRFSSRADYGVGAAPSALAIGDANGDQRPDILVADYGADSVTVLLGSGGGVFTAIDGFVTGHGPAGIAVADLNGDQRLDVVTADENSDRISIRYGTGDGRFGPSTLFPTVGPIGVAIGDISHDGHPDIVVANTSEVEVSIFYHYEDPDLDHPQLLYTGGSEPVAVALADLDGDGWLDVIATHCCGLVIWHGGPLLTFDRPIVTCGPGLSPSLAVADLDGDRLQDIAVVDGRANQIDVYLQNVDYTLGPRTYRTGQSPGSILAADFDSDGNTDLMVVDRADRSISVLNGSGDGAFRPRTAYTTLAHPSNVGLGDFDGDGHLDAAIVSSTSDSFAILTNHGDGTFVQTLLRAGGGGVGIVTVADVNEDGRADLLMSAPPSVLLLLGRGDGTFEHSRVVVTGVSALRMDVADFNRDGHLDLAIADQGLRGSTVGGLTVVLGHGDGSFTTSFEYPHGTGEAFVTDLNDDGNLDVVGEFGADFGDSVLSFLGHGDGTFGVVRQQIEPWFAAIGLADVNADGMPDLLLGGAYGATGIGVRLGIGDGSFRSTSLVETCYSPAGLAIADMNHDGRPDLAVARADSPGVAILLNAVPRITTATRLLRFDVRVSASSITILWSFADRVDAAAAMLQRADAETGPWAALPRATLTGADAVFVDRQIVPGRAYYYRLSVPIAGGGVNTYGPIKAATDDPANGDELIIQPNPTYGPATISFTLARADDVRIRVIDVQGRLVAVLANSRLEPGRHELRWEAPSHHRGIPRGLYFVELERGGNRRVARLLTLH